MLMQFVQLLTDGSIKVLNTPIVFSAIINQGVIRGCGSTSNVWVGWAIESENILNMLVVSLEGLEVWMHTVYSL
jgi:hypothetical protein